MDGSQLVSYADPVDEISIEVRKRPWPLKRLLIGAAAVVFLLSFDLGSPSRARRRRSRRGAPPARNTADRSGLAMTPPA